MSFLADASRVDRALDAALGTPMWGPSELLRDLEVRLGLPAEDASPAARVQAYAQRLEAGLAAQPFYERSFAVDRHGTATTLLSWRDMLVLGGWTGADVSSGGRRLGALAAAEQMAIPLPRGHADRLRRVEGELRSIRYAPYEAVRLLEPLEIWPGLWRKVLARLADAGVRVAVEEHAAATGASGDTDLAATQRFFAAGMTRPGSCLWKGDGSLLWLRASTSWELGESVAGLLRAREGGDALVIRLGDAAPLEAALSLQGLATQGRTTSSALRSPLQVLPLALALCFAPKDPYRVLELLTLPEGPFGAYAGRKLAAAIAESPGVGSRAWEETKRQLAKLEDGATPEDVERAKKTAERIATWLEGPAFDRTSGAPKSALLAVTERIASWARKRPHDDESQPWQVLAHCASELAMLIAAQPNEHLLPHQVEQLAGRVLGAGLSHRVTRQQAGRIAHASHPASIFGEHDVVVVWHAGFDPGLAMRRSPFRRAEVDALERAGITLGDPERELEAQARAWRRVFSSAERTFVVATPDAHLSTAQPSLPLWDEIVARSAAAPSDVARITVGAAALRQRSGAARDLAVPVVTSPPLALPEPRASWTIEPGLAERLVAWMQTLSPTGLDSLLGCPLRYVLERVVRARTSRATQIPDKVVLYGKLGHRLAEELHARGVLDTPSVVAATVDIVLDALVQKEGGPLLMAGMAAERVQVDRALRRAMQRLSDLIARSGMKAKAVELPVEAAWGDRTLHGQTDLLLEQADGTEAILDLKYGESRYRDALEDGMVLQLAVYAEIRRRTTNAAKPPAAGYFALKAGRGLQLRGGPFDRARARSFDGPSLVDTWKRVERTTEAVLAHLRTGDIAAPGTTPERALVVRLPIAEADRDRHYEMTHDAACEYCSSKAVCGRAWEGLR